MAGFYIWETAELSISLSEPVLTDYKDIIVSIKQAAASQLDITSEQLSITDESTINVSLSQEQTGQFREGTAEIQVNIYYENSERDTTAKGTLEIRDNLYKQVMA